MRKESLGYSAQRSFEGSSSLQHISSDDVDFEDVFGGPPRRYSLHETTRYSSDGGEQTASRFRSLSSEKPVFGEGSSVSRRKYQSNDFFDDIFQGVKSGSGFGSKRQNETFGTSLPSQFSLLSAASTKAVDYHRFASTSTSESKEDLSDGISSPDATGLTRVPKRDSNATEATTDINHSHFSIYKWAGREVPLLFPSREGSDSKFDNYKPKRWSSSDGKIRSDKDGELLPANARNIDIHIRSANRVSNKIDKTSILERTEKHNTIKGVLDSKEEIIEAAKVSAKSLSDRTSFSSKNNEAKATHLHEMSRSDKTKKEVSTVPEESPKPSLKSLRSFLNIDVEGQESEDIDMTIERKGNAGATKIVEKNDGKISNSTEVNKGSTRGSPEIPGGNLKRSGVRGKVKGFIRIFNQETYSKSKSNLGYQSQSSRWEGKVTCGEFNESNHSKSKLGTEMHFQNLNMELDASGLDDNAEQPEKHRLQKTSTFYTSSDYSSHLEAFPCSESIPDDSEVKSDMTDDDPFQDKYLVELPQTSEEDQANKDLNVKIFKWSTGKEGNIRSLLSTLQYVLWAESGWKAVPLVNIIELNEVKRAYQKALLCLHPDKLQQKGANSDQKYIAEKVFVILQEAWDHFNSLHTL